MVVGQVVLRPFYGKPVVADVIRLHMPMSDNPKEGIYVYAASVSGANDDLLLTDEAVNRLTGCSSSISRVTAVSEGGVEGENPTAIVMEDQTTVLCGANSDDVENPVSSDCNDSEVLNDDVLSADDVCMSDKRAVLIAEQEQKNDPSLSGCWNLAEKLRGGFMVTDGVLYKRERWYGQEFQQLVAPSTRKGHILTMGHDTVCQKKARITNRDQVLIKAIPRANRFVYYIGPLFSGKGPKPLYNYVLVDSVSRFPVVYALESLTLTALRQIWGLSRIFRTIFVTLPQSQSR